MALVKFANGNTNKVFKPAYNDVFESFFNADPFLSKSTLLRNPAVNIAENENEFHIELAAPGLKKEDFKINLENDLLSVSAERKEEKTELDDAKKYNRLEYNYSSFMRTFTLPETADHAKISAEYKDGILYIKVAKKEEAKIMAREITIS
ncbi:MAG: Hsp20/alpha crystallin family protein [Daejeonella sp.]|uniref:Hsp20/alpha crystallin family protein n=1 Tax=Daejeonella sp. TaxID=2805397 RepID=UPI002733FB3A|nr:Hsp20/alpha crystallin family protein [Daejeonella sp.]MDP3469886.1 Hsp20/alpha crystallin family protein [Daejeonella sp.]